MRGRAALTVTLAVLAWTLVLTIAALLWLVINLIGGVL